MLKVNEKVLAHPQDKKPRCTDRNYVCTLKLECPSGDKAGPGLWILRGVAVLCDIK